MREESTCAPGGAVGNACASGGALGGARMPSGTLGGAYLRAASRAPMGDARTSAMPRAPMRGARWLALLLALALAVAAEAGWCADAWATESIGGLRLAGTPAQNEYDTPILGDGGALPGSTGLGLRLSKKPAQNEYETPGVGSSSVGLRLAKQPAQNEYDTPVGEGEAAPGASSVGIRLTKTPEQNEYDTPTGGDENVPPGASSVGIRLAKQPAQNEYDTPTGGDEAEGVGPGASQVGIRLTKTPAQNEYDTPVEGSEGVGPGASSVGIRLTGAQTFNVYFATGEGATPIEPQRVHFGDCASEPASSPTRPGFGFTGWYADEASQVPWEFDETPVLGATTIYAGWIDKPVEMAFDAGGALDGGATFADEADGVLSDDNATWVPRVEFDGGMVEGAYPGKTVADIAPPTPEFGDNVFAGWWTDDGLAEDGATPDNEWGERADGEGAAWRVPSTGATLHARWVSADIDILLTDPDGGTWGDAGQIAEAKLHLGDSLPTEGLGDVPKRPGYRLAGLWHAAGGEAVAYYSAEYAEGADGEDDVATTWSAALAGDWELVEHIEDRRAGAPGIGGAAPGESAAPDGPDLVGDTVVLVARWDVRVQATVPMWVSLALHGTPDSVPTVESPGADRFAIRSYTPLEMHVNDVTVEGLDAGGAGLGAVLYTEGGGGSKHLDYATLAGEDGRDAVKVTLDPRDDATKRVELAITSATGPAKQSAKPPADAFRLDAWQPPDPGDPTAEEAPGLLPLKLGLSLPQPARAQASGATGEIARVTFTLSATQQISW